MKFSIPKNPNRHVLSHLKEAVQGVPGVEAIVKSFLEKVDKSEQFLWRDFTPIIKIIDAPIIRDTVDKNIKAFGLSASAFSNKNDAVYRSSENKRVASSATNKHNFPMTSMNMDLDQLFNQKCKGSASKPGASKPGEWDESLFCEMGYDNSTAKYIGRLKFAIPNSTDNHVIIKLLNSIKAALETSENASWTQWAKGIATKAGVNIGLSVVFNDIVDKINRGELLLWSDLRNLFSIADQLGRQGMLEDIINSAIKEIGLQFVK